MFSLSKVALSAFLWLGLTQDPHDELKRKNVLIVRQSMAAVADHFGMELVAVEEALCRAKQILLQARLERPKPHLDDKFLTSWNGWKHPCVSHSSCMGPCS